MFKNFCHDQVKLLLERMDSNPEEFLHHHKWNPFLPDMHHVSKGTADYFRAFTPIERALITRKFNRLCESTMRQNAYNRILEVAIAGEDKGSERMRVDSTGTWGTSAITMATNAASTGLTIGNTTLTEKDLKKIKGRFWGLL